MLSNSPSKTKLAPTNSPLSEKSKESSCPPPDPVQYVSDKRRERDQKIKTQEKNKRNIANKTPLIESRPEGEILVAEKHLPKSPESINSSNNRINNKKRNLKQEGMVNSIISTSPISSTKSITSTVSISTPSSTVDTKSQNIVHNKHYKQKEILMNGISNNSLTDYNEICALFSQNVSLKGKKNSLGL